MNIPTRDEILARVVELQEEASKELEIIGPYRTTDKNTERLRAFWQTRFQMMTDLKWWIDPKSAPTSQVDG